MSDKQTNVFTLKLISPLMLCQS